MGDILPFRTRTTPGSLQRFLVEENWIELANALQHNPQLMVQGFPLWAAVMKAYTATGADQGSARVVPPHLLVETLPPLTTLEDEMGRSVTVLAWAALCGQWDWVRHLLETGFLVDTPSYSVWNAIWKGIRCAAKANSTRFP